MTEPLKNVSDAPFLKHALRSAERDGPSPEELERLTAKLAGVLPKGALSTEPPATAPQKVATHGWRAPAVSAGLLATAGAVVATGVVLFHPLGGSPTGIATNTEPPAVWIDAGTDGGPPAEHVALDAGNATPDAGDPGKRRTVVASTVASAEAGRPVPGELLSEAELLDRAQASLRRDPSAALAFTDRHRRAYPGGALSQEREVIAIEALVSLGRVEAARARAASFRTRFPGSSHLGRIDTLVPPKP